MIGSALQPWTKAIIILLLVLLLLFLIAGTRPLHLLAAWTNSVTVEATLRPLRRKNPCVEWATRPFTRQRGSGFLCSFTHIVFSLGAKFLARDNKT